MAQKGKAAAAYGTGRSESAASGYVRLWMPGHPVAMKDGYVWEHRFAWFEHNGPIPDGYEVHHKDHDHTNNAISNLELLTEAEHLDHHNRPGTLRRNQHGTWEVGQGAAAKRRRRLASLGERHCERCNESIGHLRIDARFCGSRCQVAAFKERRHAS